MFFRKCLFLVVLLCVAINAQAQEQTAGLDKYIANCLNRVVYWGQVFKTPSDYNDSLIAANDMAMAAMQKAVGDPATLKMGFEKAQAAGLIVTTSDDGKLRFYSWDTWMDPVLHCFNALAQYQTEKGVKTSVINNIGNLYKRGDPGAYYADVETIHTEKGKTIYLATDCNVAGETKGYEVRAYAIEQDSLMSVPFFRDGNVVSRAIDYAYKEQYTGDTTNGNEGRMYTLHLSQDKSRIYLPVISNTGSMTGEYYIYKFDGEYFVYWKRGQDKREERR